MPQSVPSRAELPTEYTWNMESVFPSSRAWDEEYQRVEDRLPSLQRFRNRLADGASILIEWFVEFEDLMSRLLRLQLYAASLYNVETTNQEAKARNDRAQALAARVAAAASFAEPELLAIEPTVIREWMQQERKLEPFAHYFERLEARRAHVRSSDVEEVLGLVQEPFSSSSATHRVLTDTDLTFTPAKSSTGEEVVPAQGNIDALLTSPDREIRRMAWEGYADAHLSFKNTMANCLASGVKQDVFLARVRQYTSSLQAALEPNHIPLEVFRSLIATYRRNVPIWHRYWRIRKQALGYEKLHAYDIKAPLTAKPTGVPYSEAVEWIVQGMQPLGDEYVQALRRGVNEDRWVDVYPNQGKRSGAYSSGAPGTHPFILMSYHDDIFSMSTLAHELGHSLHSYFTRKTQPFVYIRYGLFLAEVASNFNQALVRAHLLNDNADPDFQIAVIEEAMSNFHRYFLIMPTLARFELGVHEQAERGEGISADYLMGLMAELFAEAYGDEVEIDVERVGITWAQFPVHMYLNFYVYQYATGIAAAQALSQQVLDEGPPAADRYMTFLKSGGSRYPLETLESAGVDMTSSEPVQQAFDVMSSMVDRLQVLLAGSKSRT